MTQRKLTDDELQKVMTARHDIKYMCKWEETDRGREYWHGVWQQLEAMARHATTDGEPYVDPEPPIPDGYRKMVAADQGRRDVKFWSSNASEWQGRPFPDAACTSGDRYIVPIAPPIPEGYRKAVSDDEGRRDVKILAKQSNEWIDRPYKNMGFCVGDTYIVPADIAPTDEEAAVTPRIKVMVRNFSTDLWQKKTLLAVRTTRNEVLRFVTDGGSWIFCRYPYQGE